MKNLFPLFAGVWLILAASLSAQEQPAKQKSMVFQPGAKTPDGAIAVPPPPEKGTIDASAADAPAQFASQFFGLLQKGEIDKAYAALTKGSKIAERPDEVKTLKAKTKEAIEVFGAIQGFEVAESKTVGTRLLRRTYVSLGKDFPLRWRFYFYKPNFVWRLIDLRVDDRLAGMFDEPEEPRAPETKQ